MKNLVTNRHKQFLFIAVTAFVFIFAAQSLTMAQTQQRKFKPGDEIEMGRGVTYKIVECRIKPNTGEEECDFVAFFEDGTRSNLNTSLAFNLRRDEQLAKAEKKRLEVINGGGKTNNQPKPPAETPPQENERETETPGGDDAELTVTAQQLYSEYNNNDTAARRKYVGKTVRVTGAVVYTISETKFSARFNKTYSGSTIQCHLEDIEQIATLNKGETLTIVGKPLGSLTSTGVIFEPCRIERKTANQTTRTTTKTPVKTPVKTTAGNVGNVVGTWYYTAIINADGSEQKLSNSESYLWLKEDGSYENRFGAVGQIGTYAGAAGRLTLNRENVGSKTYTMTISGKTMILKSGAGGYKLERE
jgi:hypothetical protein